ncbi:HDOD domain-containing protein [Ectothiorhodospiraceae bacterium WFHF3C12]|nr:HDOD domain-containing protein [Ectothiorhodospiraceae bacterium WFHF3C12]
MSHDLYIGRQPILDRSLEVVGYELLFRSPGAEGAQYLNADLATAQVMAGTFSEIGLEQVVGSQPAYLNLTRPFLVGDLPLPLSPEQVALEITTAEIRGPEELDALHRLRDEGYRIVLDEFRAGRDNDALLELASTVKFDIQRAAPDTVRQELATLTAAGICCIALRVERREEFEQCMALGFERFQGYFFCRPESVRGHTLPANVNALLAMVGQLDDPEANMDALERVVAQDPAFCYRLLRYINGATFALRREIDTLREALTLLGTRVVRNWAMLMLIAELDYPKPDELFKTSLVRARLCERLAADLNACPPDQAFLVGLLSCLDAMLDRDMEDLLDTLSLSAHVKLALLDHEGPLGTLLDCAITQESGRIAAGQVDAGTFNRAYLDALTWAEENIALLESVRQTRPSVCAR